MSSIELTVRCKPWREGRSALHPVLVDLGEHPRVRVWDPVGRIYTVCHSLTPRAEARIVREAGGIEATGKRTTKPQVA